MSATLVNSTVILNETLDILDTECKSLQAVNREYDSRFGDNAQLKPGTSLQVRKPIQVTIRSGKKADIQDTVEETVSVSCTTQIGVDLPAFTSEQLTMNVDSFRDRYLRPAALRIAAEIDKLILQYGALNFYQFVGTPGTIPATTEVFLQASQKLDEVNAKSDKRYALISPAANTKMVASTQGLFLPGNVIAEQYRSGYMQTSLGLDIAQTNNLHRVTCGTRSGTAILVDEGAGTNLVEGMTMVHIDGLGGATQTIKAGEKFTISGVYSVSPETKISTGNLMQFTVTQDFIASGSEGDLYFSPAIRATGARQNVTALPVDGTDGQNGELTFQGTASTSYRYNLVMQKDALAFVTADLPLPKGVHDAKRDKLKGISMRFITDYDAKNDEFISRFDIFYGISKLYDQLGVVMFDA